MAKDLTSFRLTLPGASSSAKHLASVSKDGASHLAVIRLTSRWSNRQFVLTPSVESFSAAVASAYTANYSSNSSPATTYADGNGLRDTLASVWTAKTDSSWHSGHKAICSYFACGDGPFTRFGRNPIPQYPARYIEAGQTRVALKFNPLAFPAPKCSSFSASLRVWCPSALYEQLGVHGPRSTRGFSHNDAGVLDYAFASSLPAPSAIDASHYSARVVDEANNGLALDSAPTYTADYDIWNNSGESSDLPVYKTGTSSSSFHSADFPITGDALDDLKAHMLSPFWLVAGFRNANGFASYANGSYSHMAAGVRAVFYASRLELIITASANSFN